MIAAVAAQWLARDDIGEIITRVNAQVAPNRIASRQSQVKRILRKSRSGHGNTSATIVTAVVVMFVNEADRGRDRVAGADLPLHDGRQGRA